MQRLEHRFDGRRLIVSWRGRVGVFPTAPSYFRGGIEFLPPVAPRPTRHTPTPFHREHTPGPPLAFKVRGATDARGWGWPRACPAAHITLIFVIVTDQATTPASRGHRQQQQPHRDEDLLRRILDTAHEAFIMIDADGLILEFNREAERTFGFTRERGPGARAGGDDRPGPRPGRSPRGPAPLRRHRRRQGDRAAHRDERAASRGPRVPGRDDDLRSQLSRSARRPDRVSRLPARHLGAQAVRARPHRDAVGDLGDGARRLTSTGDGIAALDARRVDGLAGRGLLAAGP